MIGPTTRTWIRSSLCAGSYLASLSGLTKKSYVVSRGQLKGKYEKAIAINHSKPNRFRLTTFRFHKSQKIN